MEFFIGEFVKYLKKKEYIHAYTFFRKWRRTEETDMSPII
jgi:hypothetical protein